MARPRAGAIGRYQILGFKSRGETSLIYEALDPDSGQAVALKILPPSAMRVPERVDDFLRVAGRLAAFDHPNLLPVLDYGRQDATPFVVTPIAQGGSLLDNLGAYGQTRPALTLVADLAQAAGYLHDHDIVHGRIEPGHVLLDADGRPLLTGIGRPYPLIDPDSPPAYVAPEQRQEGAPDERTDIFQLGCLLHQLLLGRPPDADGEGFAGFLAAGLHEEVAVILAQALAAEPVARFSSAAELADHLVAASERQPASEPVADLEPEPDLEPAADLEPSADLEPAPVLVQVPDLHPEVPSAARRPVVESPVAPPPVVETPAGEPVAAVPVAAEAAGQPGPSAPESLLRVLPGPLRDKNPLWLAAAFAGLALILTLCCVFAAFGAYAVSGRLSKPLATAHVDTNVRSGPGTESAIVGLLRADEEAKVYGVSPDGHWWQIAFAAGAGGRAWVPSTFVTVEGEGKVDVFQPPPG